MSTIRIDVEGDIDGLVDEIKSLIHDEAVIQTYNDAGELVDRVRVNGPEGDAVAAAPAVEPV